MKLVIVESPTKAKTIEKFLGKGFVVESSYGHVRDLPKSKLGIDIDHDFEPQYIIPRKIQSRVTALRKKAAKSDEVILATDEDREGEAIAWHLVKALDLEGRPIERIVFHEITESAIKEALAHPRSIYAHLVDAQQARRVLDRLVGYKLSPFLWKKVVRGLSAGRVQSVALKLIVDREEEIKRFAPQEYWSIGTLLKAPQGEFEAFLAKIDGAPLDKLGIEGGERANAIVAHLKNASYTITELNRREVHKNPLPPFTTSTLQQAAAGRLGFSSKRTMFLAQALYENGYITYMRTDSVNLSKEALAAAQGWITEHLGASYYPGAPRLFKNKSRLAQEAHEAIRPAHAHVAADEIKLDRDHARLYELIWRRFIASQMQPAIFDAMSVDVEADAKEAHYGLRANGNLLKFDGFLKVWPTKFEEKELPKLSKSDALSLSDIRSEQHFTEPPPRFNEASLIKILEQYGIGRPSTYSPTISVIQDRNYVEKNQGRFYPTEIGTLVNKLLTENFPQIVDIQFTAHMEENLDAVAEGKEDWRKVIRDFYVPFAKNLEEKYESVSKESVVQETTDEKCEKCGRPMIVKFGRFGKFLACSGFPDCKNTKTLKNPPKPTGITCPTCGIGELVERRVQKKGRARGKIFWGCSRYPDCSYAVWDDPTKPKEEKPAKKKKDKETKEAPEEAADDA